MATEQELRLRAAARRRRQQAQPAEQAPQRGTFDRFARGFGDAMASAAGLPLGAAMELGNLTGLTEFEDVSGANTLRRAGAEIGLTSDPDADEDLGIAGAAGEGLAIAGSLGAGSMGLLGRGYNFARSNLPGAVQTFSGRLRHVADVLSQPAAVAPVRTGVAELVAGSSAAATGEFANRTIGEDDWRTPIYEIAGGVLGGATALGTASAVTSGAGFLKDTLLGQTGLATMRLFGVGRTLGGQTRAADRVGQVVSNPQEAALRLRGGGLTDADDIVGDVPLTPAQRAGDSGLMNLHARVRADDPALMEQWRRGANQSTSRVITGLRQTLGDEGDPSAAIGRLQQLKDDAIQTFEDMTLLASVNAADKITQLGPRIRPEEAARITRRELEAAAANGRRIQTAMWEALPKEETVAPANLRQWYDTNLDELGTEDVARMLPASVRRFFNREAPVDDAPQFLDARGRPMVVDDPDPLPDPASTFGEMQAMRSDLLRAARGLRGGNPPDLNRARLMEEAADSIVDDFLTTGSGLAPDHQDAFNAAREFSARYNDLYRRGTVGDLLRRKADGGLNVDPDLTLTRAIGAGEPLARGVAARDIEAAVGNNPEVWGAVDDFLRHQFTQRAVQNGQVNTAAAQSFLRDNDALFSQRPALREVFDDVIEGSRTLQDLTQQSSDLARSLNDPKIARSEVFLARAGDGDVNDGISRIFSSLDSGAVTRDIISKLDGDPTGEALSGFRKAFSDELLQRSMRQSDTLTGPEGGGNYISGQWLREVLDGNPDGPVKDAAKINRAIKELYTSDEIAQMRRWANTAYRVERDILAQGTPEDRVLSDTSNRLLELSAGVLGAKAGRALGTGTIQAPGYAGGFLRDMARRGVADPARRVLVDAFENEKLMDTLLAHVQGDPLTPNMQRYLSAYIEALGPDLGELQQQQPPQVPQAPPGPPTPVQSMPQGPLALPPAGGAPAAPQAPQPRAGQVRTGQYGEEIGQSQIPIGDGFRDMYNRIRGR